MGRAAGADDAPLTSLYAKTRAIPLFLQNYKKSRYFIGFLPGVHRHLAPRSVRRLQIGKVTLNLFGHHPAIGALGDLVYQALVVAALDGERQCDIHLETGVAYL